MSLHAALAGADLHAPSNYLVENDTGIVITKLTVCTFNGIGTTFPSAVPITSSGQTIRGVALADISATAGSNIGYITALGFYDRSEHLQLGLKVPNCSRTTRAV